MIECYFKCQSDNGSITEAHALHQWSDKYFESIDDIKDPRAPLRLYDLCRSAGFVDVECKMIPLPLCGWPTGMRAFTSFLVHISGRIFYDPADANGKLLFEFILKAVSTDSTFFIDPRERSIGMANTQSTSRLLGTLALFPFSSRLEMSFEEIEVLLAHARADAANTALKPYFPLQVLKLITFLKLS